jgi:hypothetical protein
VKVSLESSYSIILELSSSEKIEEMVKKKVKKKAAKKKAAPPA